MQSGANRPWYRARWLRMLLLFVLLIAGGFTAFWWVQSTALNTRLDELRAQDLPTSLLEMDTFYAVPAGATDTTDAWIAACSAVDELAKGTAFDHLPIFGKGPRPIPPPGSGWTELEACRSFLSESDEPLAAIRAACLPGGCARFPIDFSHGISTQLTHLQSLRNVARLLALDAHVSLHGGDQTRALQDIRDVLHTSEILRSEPTLIGQLVRLALFAIACDLVDQLLPYMDTTDADLAQLQEMLRRPDFADAIRVGLCGERAFCLHVMRTNAPRILFNKNADEALDLFQVTISSLSDGWLTAIATQSQVSTKLRTLMAGVMSRMIYMPLLLMMPAQENAVIAGARSAAKQRSLISAIAAERYRRRHGTWPASLDDIPIELFAPSVQASPDRTDPFTGDPLQYVADENSVTIYSVGPDLTDDGGAITDGVQVPASDTGVRLQAAADP